MCLEAWAGLQAFIPSSSVGQFRTLDRQREIAVHQGADFDVGECECRTGQIFVAREMAVSQRNLFQRCQRVIQIVSLNLFSCVSVKAIVR